MASCLTIQAFGTVLVCLKYHHHRCHVGLSQTKSMLHLPIYSLNMYFIVYYGLDLGGETGKK